MGIFSSKKATCGIVKYGTLKLETKAGREPNYNGCLVMEEKLLVIDCGDESYLHVYNLHDGKLITSHRLEFPPWDVCLINTTEVAVCLGSEVVILSVTSRDGVKLVNTLQTGFGWCSLVKWRSDKLVISGQKGGMLCWGILSITDGRLDSTHDICTGRWTHVAVREDTVYISCRTYDSITDGVYAFNLLRNKQKFLYQHQELIRPWSIMADRDYVYVCDRNRIHQLTDSGQLVTIHTVSSRPRSMFYDDQQGLLYTTSEYSNVITVYKMEFIHQQDSVVPAEVLKMDTRSLYMYKDALNEGKEKVYNIKVMVVGQYGVGKTTLTQRLLGKNVNISERHSTDGIDIHIECSKISLSTGEWTTQEKNAEQYSRLQRLVKLLNERVKKQDFEGKQERHVEIVDMVTSEENITGHNQHGLPVSANHLISQEVKQPPSQPAQPPSQPAQLPIAKVGPESSSESGAKTNEKDAVMEILQLVNENSGQLNKSNVEYAALGLWDFAGQYVFYTTHQTFMTSRAIYLLVIDLSQQITDLIKDDECFIDMEGIKQYHVHEFIEIWLNSVHSCEPTSHPGTPPVILVGTHADKIPEKNRQEVILAYFMKIRQMLKDKPIVLHLMDSIAIDNTQCDPKLDDLKRRIFELASEQPYWGEEKPARWIALEQKIMTLKVSGVKVVPLSLIEEINRSASVRIKDREELELFLCFQHEIGTILYFSVEVLREKIVLDPQWLIDALKSLITAQMFIIQNPAIIKKWYAFKEKGKLTHELIDAVWTKKEKPDFHDNKEHIILVMEKLNIIARPISYTEDGMSVKEEDYFLAPCMLREATPKGVICPESHPENEATSVLCFVCKGKFLPTPIFHRLLGACLTRWPIAKTKSENQIYCGCCVFDLDHHHTLTLHFFGHVIFARAIGRGVTDTSQSSKLCTAARKFIYDNLLKITRNLGQSLEFEMHIQCPNCDPDSTEGLFDVPLLQKHAKVVCNSHEERHTLVSQKLLRLWFEDGSSCFKRSDSQIHVRAARSIEIQSELLKPREDSENENEPSRVTCSDPNLLCQILQTSQQAVSCSESTLEANCLSVGLELHGETPADGNCFFEAVSSQLQRLNCVVRKSPQQLRQEVVAFMRTNRGIQASEGTIHLDSFIYSESFDDYCSRMARDDEWADHVVVVAMARMLQIDIMIVTSSPLSGPENIIVWVVGKTDFQDDPILLGHVWESHYMSLQPIATADLAGHYKQAQTNVPTPAPTAHVIDISSSGSISSTSVGLIIPPTTGSTPYLTSPTAGVMQTATTSFIRTDLMQASALGSTTTVMQMPTSVPTATNVLLATASVSTPTTTTGYTQCPTSTSTTIMQVPTSVPTTTNVLLATASVSTRTTTTGYTQCPTSTSTTTVMQAPTYVPTTTNMLATSASTPSTTTGSTPCTTFTYTTTATEAQTSAPTTKVLLATFASTSSPTTGSTQCPTLTSTTVTQAPTSVPTTTNVLLVTSSMLTPSSTPCTTFTSTTTVMQASSSVPITTNVALATTYVSTPYTTTGSTPCPTFIFTTAAMQAPISVPITTSVSLATSSTSTPCTATGSTPCQSPTSTTAAVMQAPSLDDTDRFMHIACLLVNVGSRVLRRLLHFHMVTPTCTLDQYFSKKKTDIDNLRKRKILNKSQMDILFPPGGTTNLGDYDITLLSALFTNIVPNISQQQLNMIQSLRDKRNEIFAHAKSVMVNSNDYQTFWNDICKTLEALSKQCNDPDFENEIYKEIQGIQLSTVQGSRVQICHEPGSRVQICHEPGYLVHKCHESGCRVQICHEPGSRVQICHEPGSRVQIYHEPGSRVQICHEPVSRVQMCHEPGSRVQICHEPGSLVQICHQPGS
ncbi:hypothetical protein ACJMK2_001754 [Sinanodonta woodiana]|uniref:non-specific serine/threonine protein kinase n=1 Tax=Sinanodonta woodiana TaxID=1069815 RepID=A0ABD3XUY7_SINWO